MKHLILLTKMMEECGELTQMCSKVLLHGEENTHPATGAKNIDLLKQEMVDVMVVMEMLGQEYQVDKDELLEMFKKKTSEVQGLVESLSIQPSTSNISSSEES